MEPIDFILIASDDHEAIVPSSPDLHQVAVFNFKDAKRVFTHIHIVAQVICLKEDGTWGMVSNIKDAEEFYGDNQSRH